MLGLVLKRQSGQWLFAGAIDAGYGWYDSKRSVAFDTGTASGSLEGQHAGLHGRIAYSVPLAEWYFKPYVDFEAVYLRTAGYAERGGGPLALNVASSDDAFVAASPMLETGGQVRLDRQTMLMPFVSLGGIFYNRNQWTTQARLAGSSPGVAPFEMVSRLPTEMLKLNVGTSLAIGHNVELKAEYDGEFGGMFRSDAATLKLDYLF